VLASTISAEPAATVFSGSSAQRRAAPDLLSATFPTFPTFLSSHEAIMVIEFPQDAPDYHSANLTIVFDALVDGARVPCAISVEALEDHFDAQSFDSSGWIGAFDAGRPRIEAVAREHLRVSNGLPVLLQSGHFPPGKVIA
jgi:hypothetical protein